MTSEARQSCVAVLQQVADNPAMIDQDEQLKGLIAKIYRTQRKTSRQADGVAHREADRAVRHSTGIIRRDAGNAIAASGAPGQGSVGALHRARACYVCRQPYQDVHFFYHRLCPACAAFHYAKRSQTADLTGRVALVTGGRVKIGFQLALRLLRDGARVIVTTRFASDADRRFRSEPDYGAWADRLNVVALDLRNLPAVEAFTGWLMANEPWLDILVNNAAQTVKRPLAFYRHLLDGESSPPVLLEARRCQAQASAASLPAMASSSDDGNGDGDAADTLARYFPDGARDADGQQIDARPVHSWRLRLHEVEMPEMVEVQLVNSVAPFLLCSRLKEAFLRSPHARRFVVHVSAMEGQFARESKTVYHPHTNMAKAALNMLTRTSAADYARDGIYMNSVDTGWITDENPLPVQERYRAITDFHPPLDAIDGMARIYDPIACGVNEADTEPLFGHFLKDYAPHAW